MRNVYDILNEVDESVLRDGSVLSEGNENIRLTEQEKLAAMAFVLSREDGEKAALGAGQRKKRPVYRKKRSRFTLVSVAAAAAILTGCVVFAAVRWNKGLEEYFHLTTEQQEFLEEQNMAAFAGQSDTQEGITVTAEQCVVDLYNASVSFRVTGYELEEGEEPGFDSFFVKVGDDAHDSAEVSRGYGISFYGEMTADSIEYVQDDGSLECVLHMQAYDKEFFSGQPLHVELWNLGIYTDKAELTTDVEAVWSFDLTMPEASEAVVLDLNEELGDSGATVIQAELSPLSMSITYQFEKQEITEIGYAVTENGEEPFEHHTYKEPPALVGVRMKDGTSYYDICGGAAYGYREGTDDIYDYTCGLTRVLDVEQIESLLFVKEYPEGEIRFTDENLYIVPITQP